MEMNPKCIQKEKETFFQNYFSFVLEALKILKRRIVFLEPCEKEEQKIKDRIQDFKKETFIQLESLRFFYQNIEISFDPLQMKGATRQILIPYQEKNIGIHGTKIGGRYLATISLENFKNTTAEPEDVMIKIKKVGCSENEYIHPHISHVSGGQPCWGGEGIKNTMRNLLLSAAFLDVLLCIFSFLSRVNLGSCYESTAFLKWREAETKNKT